MAIVSEADAELLADAEPDGVVVGGGDDSVVVGDDGVVDCVGAAGVVGCFVGVVGSSVGASVV